MAECLTIDPTSRPTAAQMLQHRWLSDELPHFVPDPTSPTGGPTDLLPHIQKKLDARSKCEPSYFLALTEKNLIVGGMRSPQSCIRYHSDEAYVSLGPPISCGTRVGGQSLEV